MADSPDDLGIPMKPSRPIGSPASLAQLGRTPAAVPPRVPEMARPPAEPPRPAEQTRRAVTEPIPVPVAPPPLAAAPPPLSPAPPPRRAEGGLRQLTVGREISLSGEIASCDTLIVEGSVEANLQNCRDVDIAETGLFKGSAEIDNADVRGAFEGNLIVRKRLLIRSGGMVSGTIRYGQIEIELGGQISGDVQSAAGDIVAELPNARAVS
ncbi:MAG TPA: polymer-forming cytoskeletal protein [Stellaceae bacterium]|jgi:cytoskeletal protein CcmA (bactofilin family)|nr:polymer-forming cytoskeletal protein [Stellaceae bacterium]